MTVREKLIARLRALLDARYPVIGLVSHEEKRAESILTEAAAALETRVQVWCSTKGFLARAKPRAPESGDDVFDPIAALDEIEKRAADAKVPPTIYVLRDFHAYLENSQVVRRLRDVAGFIDQTGATLVLLAPELPLPSALTKEVVLVDVPLPDAPEIAELAGRLVKAAALEQPSGETSEAAVRACLGLSLREAESALALSLAVAGHFDPKVIAREKHQIVRAAGSGALEFIAPERLAEAADVGGLDALKAWLGTRAAAFSDAAREFGLDPPKGLLLAGVPGTGKSLCAKATPALLGGLPLLRLDIGALFSQYVGSSEATTRQALKIAEAVAPVVLWLDEIDKGLSESAGSDGGTTARVVATILTWLQERDATRPVFVVSTANDCERLRPELLRKGRWDEMFFVDLPNPNEVREILAVHLRRRRRDPDALITDALVERLAEQGFSGGEIEALVVDALYTAFGAARELVTADLIDAANRTIPLKVTMAEPIARLRKWASERARPASTPFRAREPDAPAAAPRRAIGRRGTN